METKDVLFVAGMALLSVAVAAVVSRGGRAVTAALIGAHGVRDWSDPDVDDVQDDADDPE